MISRENLDKRIRDVELGTSNNDQTYRQFIHESEDEFGLPRTDSLDEMSDDVLREYLEELDYLWTK